MIEARGIGIQHMHRFPVAERQPSEPVVHEMCPNSSNTTTPIEATGRHRAVCSLQIQK